MPVRYLVKERKHQFWMFQSMPKMPENEAKEETAESREEKKEQVKSMFFLFLKSSKWWFVKERLKAAEAKRIEKERTEKYTKMKSQAKDERAKFREKVLIEKFVI